MFGTTSVISALYWMQYYYYHFWYGSVAKYAATDGQQKKLYLMNCYTMWGLAENINAITLLLFFVVWTGIMHYVDAVRFVVVGVIKIVGFWFDTTTAVESYKGLQKNYHVSKSHSLAYWD